MTASDDPALFHVEQFAPARDGISRGPRWGRALLPPSLFALLVALLLAVTWSASSTALGALSEALAWLERRNDAQARATVTVVLIAAAALGFVVTWGRALAPRRPVRLGGGRGTMPVADVAAWLRAALEARPDVRLAEARVQNLHRRGLRVALSLNVTPDARLEETMREAQAIVAHVVGEQIGTRLAGTPAIELRYEELILRQPVRDA